MKQVHDGFTLIELLMALFIFTIVSMILVSVMHSVLTTQAVTDKKAARFAALQTTLLLLSRDIEQVVDRQITRANGAVEEALLGVPDAVFMTHGGRHNPNGQLQSSTLQRIGYLLENHALIRESWDVLDQSSKSLPNRRVLLSNVDNIHLEYLDEKNHFQARWPLAEMNHTSLPRAVRITLIIKDWGKISQLYVIPITTMREATI